MAVSSDALFKYMCDGTLLQICHELGIYIESGGEWGWRVG